MSGWGGGGWTETTRSVVYPIHMSLVLAFASGSSWPWCLGTEKSGTNSGSSLCGLKSNLDENKKQTKTTNRGKGRGFACIMHFDSAYVQRVSFWYMFQIIVSVRFGHSSATVSPVTQNYLCIVLPEPQDATLFWKTWVYVYDMLMMGMWSSEKMGDFHRLLRLGPMLLTKTVSWDRKLREAEEVCFWDDIDLDNFPRDLWFLYLAVQDLGSRMK